jgi:hypothetical protein
VVGWRGVEGWGVGLELRDLICVLEVRDRDEELCGPHRDDVSFSQEQGRVLINHISSTKRSEGREGGRGVTHPLSCVPFVLPTSTRKTCPLRNSICEGDVSQGQADSTDPCMGGGDLLVFVQTDSLLAKEAAS